MNKRNFLLGTLFGCGLLIGISGHGHLHAGAPLGGEGLSPDGPVSVLPGYGLIPDLTPAGLPASLVNKGLPQNTPGHLLGPNGPVIGAPSFGPGFEPLPGPGPALPPAPGAHPGAPLPAILSIK